MASVKNYPANANSRSEAAQRVVNMKQAELVRRGSSKANAAKHANNMVACQSTGDPNGTPSY